MAHSDRPRQAVVLAGGLGTRMRPLTLTTPKPMIAFHGKPFLEYIVEMLREQGFERILMLLGYLPDVVMEHFGDGSRWGVRIDYRVTPAECLTAQRVKEAAPLLDQTFLLLYCDNYWPMQFDAMWQQYLASGVEAQITVYTNKDGFSRDGVRVEDGLVTVFDRSRKTPGLRGVEISYAIVSRDAVLPLLPEEPELFEQAVYPALSARGKLGAYETDHRYYSVGTLERLPITEAFLKREPAILLDRDGTLNTRAPRGEYITRPEDLHFLPGTLEALCRLKEAGYRVIVISNQAGIGRGMMTADDLERVNRRLRNEVAAAGGRIDAIYHCPHNWDDGCECRKPKPGMLHHAQRDFHLDLSRTLFVGDDPRDEEAAVAAGARYEMVRPGHSLLDIVSAELPPTPVGVSSD